MRSNHADAAAADCTDLDYCYQQQRAWRSIDDQLTINCGASDHGDRCFCRPLRRRPCWRPPAHCTPAASRAASSAMVGCLTTSSRNACLGRAGCLEHLIEPICCLLGHVALPPSLCASQVDSAGKKWGLPAPKYVHDVALVCHRLQLLPWCHCNDAAFHHLRPEQWRHRSGAPMPHTLMRRTPQVSLFQQRSLT